jgi:hypothetical protein
MIQKFATFSDALLGRVLPRMSAQAAAGACTLQNCGAKGCKHLCCPGSGCGPCFC